MSQLDSTRNPTQLVSRLTRLKIIRFDPQPIWPANPIDSTWTRPNPPVLPRLPTTWPSWGRVRFAPNMDIQHLQKGDNDSLWSEVMKSFSFIGCACAGLLLGACASFSMPLISLSLSRIAPHVVQGHFSRRYTNLGVLTLSLPATTWYNNCIMIQMEESQFDICLLYLATFLGL